MIGLLPRRVLPVLMYHRVGETAPGDPALSLTRAAFERQLDWLVGRGVRALGLDEAFQALTARRPPARAALLTIDDGFAATLAAAGEALDARGLTAATFVPAALVGRQARLPPLDPRSRVAPAAGRVADSAELAAWTGAGHGVGAHALDHVDMTGLEDGEKTRQAAAAKRRLEELLALPVEDFCYPYARQDAASRRAVAAAGYRAAYAGEPPLDDLFAVPRMMVYPDDSERRFARKLSGFYYWLAAWHRRLGGPRRRSRP